MILILEDDARHQLPPIIFQDIWIWRELFGPLKLESTIQVPPAQYPTLDKHATLNGSRVIQGRKDICARAYDRVQHSTCRDDTSSMYTIVYKVCVVEPTMLHSNILFDEDNQR